MKFLATNLVTEAATTVTASSASPNFPASNLTNPLRSKRWRSSGTFVVDSTNNKINFKEASGGAQLTATISPGTYSVSDLQMEIANKLHVAGTATYTVTFGANSGLWTIATSGAYLSLLNGTGSNVATSLLVNSLGFPASDKTGALTYTGSVIAIHTLESVTFDLATIQDISSIVILWPKEDGIRLSPGATIRIQGNATNSWTSPAVNQILTVDDTYLVASYHFATIQSYRYWRVTVSDPTNPDLYVELGMVWIGENIAFNEPENGFKPGILDQSQSQKTPFGHVYTDEYPLLSTLEFNYAYLNYSTYQALENAYRSNGSRKPVLVVLDDQQLVFNKNHFLIYGLMSNTFNPLHVMYDMFSGGLKITELG